MISNGCLAPLLRQASVTSSQSIAARKSATTFGARAVASTANAEEPTPPNVEVAFTKVTDGTGFGTADQCWLDSANGYTGGANDDKSGDNTADDGVVCSGDYVEYEMDLKFKGGVNNSVRLVPSVPEGFPLSYSSGKGSFCRSEGQLSAKGYNGGGCTFRAPDGYTNEVRQTLWYLADNYGGKPLRGQTMTFDLYTGDDADGWAKYSSVELEPVTVISMTYAEASVDTDDGYDLKWGKDAKTLEGTLNIHADPIRPKASQTAKGLSNRSIGWSGTLDLSAFPTGTYLKGAYGGKTFRPADGKLHLDSATDGTSFNIEIPTPKACGDGEHPERQAGLLHRGRRQALLHAAHGLRQGLTGLPGRHPGDSGHERRQRARHRQRGGLRHRVGGFHRLLRR